MGYRRNGLPVSSFRVQRSVNIACEPMSHTNRVHEAIVYMVTRYSTRLKSESEIWASTYCDHVVTQESALRHDVPFYRSRAIY